MSNETKKIHTNVTKLINVSHLFNEITSNFVTKRKISESDLLEFFSYYPVYDIQITFDKQDCNICLRIPVNGQYIVIRYIQKTNNVKYLYYVKL